TGDHRFLRGDALRNRAGDIVFQHALAGRRKKRKSDGRVEHVDRQPQIERFAFGGNRLALDAVQLGGIFRVRIRQRIELLDGEFAAGVLFELIEEVLGLLGVIAQEDGFRRRVLGPRAVEANFDRGIDFLQNRLRALRKRVGPFPGEVEALLESGGDDVETGQQDEHRPHADSRVKNGLELFLLHRPSWGWSTCPVSAQDHARREERETNQGQKEDQVARVQNSLLEILEVCDDAQGGNTIDDPGLVGHLGKNLRDGRETGQDEEQAGHHREDEADHLVARDGRGYATDGQITARHQQAPDVTAEHHAVIRAAQVVDGYDQRKG